jgi:5'-nucleotidase
MRRLICLSLVVLTAYAASGPSGSAQDVVWLTLLHNNDGESKLLNAGAGPLADYGGVARYKTLIDSLKAEASAAPTEAQRRNRIVLNICSGDNFLVGPQFAASLAKGPPYYDAIAMSHIGYDAAAIGNHEFDYGPNTLGEFIGSFFPPVPFLSANLNVEPEAALQAKVATGQIAPFVVVEKRGQRFGIIGATTPRLPFISSPRNVELDEDVAGAVQAAINKLQSEGVNRIILSSHLQTVTEDLALIPRLRGVDIAIAGGGDELLANPGDLLVPGDTTQRTYPIMVRGADGTDVPVVTTAGDYKYIGRLVVAFDPSGRIIQIDEEKSGPVRVSGVAWTRSRPIPRYKPRSSNPWQRSWPSWQTGESGRRRSRLTAGATRCARPRPMEATFWLMRCSGKRAGSPRTSPRRNP